MINLYLNFKEVFQYLIPAPIRGVRFVAWLGAMFGPLQSLNVLLFDKGAQIRYDLRFTGQVVSLEHLLNDQFDNTLRRIYIDDPSGQQILTPYVFNKVEAQPPLNLFNKADGKPIFEQIVLRNKVELLGTTDDFIVHVPTVIFSSAIESQMRFFIDRYRIAGKRYSFIIF
jgi:hypothetical protein